jgi:hypothetical protein
MGEIKYTYPNFGPWAHNQENFLWIDITVLTITNQKTIARGDAQTAIPTTPQGTKFRLLAPADINFGISHHWDDYENITSRLSNIVSSWYTPLKDLRQTVTNAYNALTQSGTGVTGGAATTVGAVENAIGGLANSDVVNYRVDTPLVYKASDPIQYVFPFEFAVYGKGKTTGADIYDIINQLLRFSSPKKPNEGIISIKPPNIFHIQTWPDTKMFTLQRAALTSATINMKEHYHHGYPSTMQANVTFQDITPLFDDKFPQYEGLLPVATGAVTTPGSEGQ